MSSVAVIVRSGDPRVLAAARTRPGMEVTAELPLVDGFAATVDSAQVASMQRAGALVVPDFDVAVPPDETPVPASQTSAGLENSRKTLDIEALWKDGYRGQGIGIAVVDTGIYPHRDLRDRITAFHDIVNGEKDPYDDMGHGTHVAGILAGDGHQSGGRYAGMAPAATLIGIKAFDENGHTQASRVVEALQWAVQNRETYKIRVINLSIGAKASLPAKYDPLVAAVDKAWQAGIFVTTAAGNNGPRASSVETPGISPTAITVANVDTRGTPRHDDDRINRSSGRGPTPIDGLAKPDVSAPGTSIRSCDTNAGYVDMTGTSMATPMVAGTAALLLSAHPDATPDKLKQALVSTAVPMSAETTESQGHGMIAPTAALAALTRR